MVVASQPGLLPILEGVAGIDVLVGNDDDLPAFDCHLPLLSLPRVLKTREETIPREPYLKVRPEAAAAARRRLAEMGALTGTRVGIAWAGNPRHRNDRNRSMRLELFAPLWAVPGVRWLSLQEGQAIPPELPLTAAVGDGEGIEITAAMVAEMDLVITVDSMPAHLAGALGRPVWILLSFAADWRWMTGREDSPWYPTMRLFRQPRFGAWEDVVERVGAELRALIGGPDVLRHSFSQAERAESDMDISGQPSDGRAGKTPENPTH